jgi:hypothetical protein
VRQSNATQGKREGPDGKGSEKKSKQKVYRLVIFPTVGSAIPICTCATKTNKQQ